MGLFKKAVQKATAKNITRKFGFKDKLAYAFGDLGCNMSFALNATITTFYTMYIGLSTEIMAIIIILLKVWDGINDPIMGAIMDRYKPKNGKSKFKVFILWGSIALTVSGALVFLPIAKAPTFVKILSCVLGYLVWDTAYTIVNVPYGAMANVITTRPEERSQLSMWRSLGSMMAQLPVMVLLPMIMYKEVEVKNCLTGEMMKGEALIGGRVFVLALVMGFFGFFAFQFLLRMSVERNSIKGIETLKEDFTEEEFNALVANSEEEVTTKPKDKKVKEYVCEFDETKLPEIQNRKIAVGITSILLYVFGVDRFLMDSKKGGKKAIFWTVLSIIFFPVGSVFLTVRSIKGLVNGIKVLLMKEDEFANYVRKANTFEVENPNKVNYFKVIASFATNRAAIGVTVASIFQLIMMQGLATATAALYKDFFGMGKESGIFQLISFLPLFIAMPLITPLVKRFGKKEASQWPLLLGVVGGGLMFVLPKELFLMPGVGIALWIVLQILVSVSFAIFATATWAMVADSIDYQELKTGRREEGTVYSIYSLGRKIAQGFGSAIVLLILGWVGFQEAKVCVDPIIGEYEVPAIQTAAVANNIRLVVGAVYCICSLVQFIMIAFVFPLSKKKVQEMNEKLGRVNEVKVELNQED